MTKMQKRKLYPEEISLMLDNIYAGGDVEETEITKNQTMIMKDVLSKQLEKIMIYEEKIPDLFYQIRNTCEISKAQCGDMVGTIAASSLGEPTTQLTLNLFHNAGLSGKDVSVGVPRFNELLNATKSDKQKKATCTVKFEKNDASSNILFEGANLPRLCEKIFEDTNVGTLLVDYELKYIPNDIEVDKKASPVGIITFQEYKEEWWVKLKKVLDGDDNLIIPESWVLILKFDIAKMLKKDIDMETIASTIEEASEGKYMCIESTNNIGMMEVYCNFSEIRPLILKALNDSLATSYRNIDNIDFFICRDVALEYIKKVKISGIKGITKTFICEETINEVRENVLTLSLAKITQIAAHKRFLEILTTKGVDSLRTICDDMHCVYAVLGIEATRKFLIKEVERVIFFDGTYVNRRHIQILIDSMTHTGEITSVRRDGIPRDAGAISKMLFEDSVPNAVQSAAFGEVDKKTSVSSSVMLGLVSRAGTGSTKVIRSREVPAKQIHLEPGFIPLDENVVFSGKSTLKKNPPKTIKIKARKAKNGMTIEI